MARTHGRGGAGIRKTNKNGATKGSGGQVKKGLEGKAPNMHMSGAEAGRVAREAGVAKLVLVHLQPGAHRSRAEWCFHPAQKGPRRHAGIDPPSGKARWS